MELKKKKPIRGNRGKEHKHRAKELTSQEELFKKIKRDREFKHTAPHELRDFRRFDLSEWAKRRQGFLKEIVKQHTESQQHSVEKWKQDI